ncbi:MAG TPA: biotin synthase BioB [Alphaproteobacteria bacterium]|nr:biotin synthase BioB [Alphaproteobacteria bacterium]
MTDSNGGREGLRHDWGAEEVSALFALAFAELIYRAQTAHRAHFDPGRVEIAQLKSIKTGACPEDCKYCPQSAHYDTGLKREKLLDADTVLAAARRAKEAGATRFCMAAAWRGPKARDLAAVASIIARVKALGLETCASLGLLDDGQAETLKAAGLDYYNHNIDTSEAFYGEVITTRSFADRLATLQRVREAGIRVCSGGIVGLGESREDRAEMLRTLANLRPHPESVPINLLMRIPGTPFEGNAAVDPLEFVRTIALARILMPASVVRLSAGREGMSDELQALCFLAGANSIFFGEKLLTAANPSPEKDRALLERLGIEPAAQTESNADAPTT